MSTKSIQLGLVMMAVSLSLVSGLVQAKLPPPAPLTEEQKAKAAEAKAKAGEAAKLDADKMAKYQDRAVANYKAGVGAKKAAKQVAQPPQKQ